MLRIDQIDVFYGDAQALDGVSLQVEPGEFVAMLEKALERARDVNANCVRLAQVASVRKVVFTFQ